MVFFNCSNCKEPTWSSDFRFQISGEMILRVYKKVCPHCKKELEFFWHENDDQIKEEEKLKWGE